VEVLDLDLPARPESVAVARRRAQELGRRLCLSERGVADLCTVVTEACMNAAVHAYDEPGGRMHVNARGGPGEKITVTVSDDGHGIRPTPSYGSPTARLGLLLMAALSRRVEIRRRSDGGTSVIAEVPAESAT
jgi:serine/threonine-protein kinase RsbW